MLRRRFLRNSFVWAGHHAIPTVSTPCTDQVSYLFLSSARTLPSLAQGPECRKARACCTHMHKVRVGQYFTTIPEGRWQDLVVLDHRCKLPYPSTKDNGLLFRWQTQTTGIMTATLVGYQKTMCRIRPHKAHHREVDGAVEWEKLRRNYRRVESKVETDDLSKDELFEHLIRGSTKQRFQ